MQVGNMDLKCFGGPLDGKSMNVPTGKDFVPIRAIDKGNSVVQYVPLNKIQHYYRVGLSDTPSTQDTLDITTYTVEYIRTPHGNIYILIDYSETTLTEVLDKAFRPQKKV